MQGCSPELPSPVSNRRPCAREVLGPWSLCSLLTRHRTGHWISQLGPPASPNGEGQGQLWVGSRQWSAAKLSSLGLSWVLEMRAPALRAPLGCTPQNSRLLPQGPWDSLTTARTSVGLCWHLLWKEYTRKAEGLWYSGKPSKALSEANAAISTSCRCIHGQRRLRLVVVDGPRAWLPRPQPSPQRCPLEKLPARPEVADLSSASNPKPQPEFHAIWKLLSTLPSQQQVFETIEPPEAN